MLLQPLQKVTLLVEKVGYLFLSELGDLILLGHIVRLQIQSELSFEFLSLGHLLVEVL